MYQTLQKTIENLNFSTITPERAIQLKPLIDYIQLKTDSNLPILLHFICTHNSRRSHFSQIWAQTAAFYHKIENVSCFSGGTEATSMFPKVVDTLLINGFDIAIVSEGSNPVYAIKYAPNLHPVIGFSKKFDNAFNPKTEYAAILTCSEADEGCPFIAGAERRISITYEDPKKFDASQLQNEKYLERSIQIATELLYVFSKIKKQTNNVCK